MKAITFLVLFAALLASARAVADDVDDLLNGGSNSATLNVTPGSGQTASDDDASDASSTERAVFSPSSHWTPELGTTVAGELETESVSTADANSKPAESLSTSLVPEPSAVILAALAMAYFLLFGRRRSVV
jgi:hypothetical protein